MSMKYRERILYLFLFLICLGIFLFSFSRLFNYEDTITRSTFTIQGDIPVPVLKMQPKQGSSGLTAIIAHGFTGSKELMAGFGAELARAGITAYLFDFPGHGQSPATFPNDISSTRITQNNLDALNEVVTYVRTHRVANQSPDIILLGHSMGSVAVGDYAMAHANEPDIVTTILVSPVGEEYPTLQQPKNLLILAGKDDIPGAISDSQRLVQEACNLSSVQSTPVECGDPTHGTGRRLNILSGLNHLTILNGSLTFQEMLHWVQRAYPNEVTLDEMQSHVRLFWLICGVAGILLSILPLSALLADIFQLHPPVRPRSGIDVQVYNICLLIGIVGTISILYEWPLFSFVGLLMVDYVSGYFFLAALIAGLLLWLTRRFVPLPSIQQFWQQLVIGAMLSVFLYITLGQITTFAWENLSFTVPRLWRFAIVFLLMLPFFLLDESVNRGYQERSLGRAILSSLESKIFLVGGLFALLLLIPSLSFLSIILPILFLLFVLLIAFSIQFYGNRRATLVTAIFSTFMIAWCLSITFPIT
jgi:pimeloyl-ACP methyl ester carboxylesterase